MKLWDYDEGVGRRGAHSLPAIGADACAVTDHSRVCSTKVCKYLGVGHSGLPLHPLPFGVRRRRWRPTQSRKDLPCACQALSRAARWRRTRRSLSPPAQRALPSHPLSLHSCGAGCWFVSVRDCLQSGRTGHDHRLAVTSSATNIPPPRGAILIWSVPKEVVERCHEALGVIDGWCRGTCLTLRGSMFSMAGRLLRALWTMSVREIPALAQSFRRQGCAKSALALLLTLLLLVACGLIWDSSNSRRLPGTQLVERSR